MIQATLAAFEVIFAGCMAYAWTRIIWIAISSWRGCKDMASMSISELEAVADLPAASEQKP